MKKIGNHRSLLALALLLLAAAVTRAVAQDITVEATVSETKIYMGEQVQLSISVTGSFSNISRPSLPEFPAGFRLISNIPSLNKNFSIINGKRSVSYIYNYNLIAQKTGDYRLPAIPVTVDGEQFKTKPIPVTVIQAAAPGNRSSDGADLFVKLEVSDNTPVTGQQLIANIVLYFKSGLEVNSYQPVPGWKAEGFWKEELESNQRPRAESVILEGVRYRKARLLQFALFPTKAGQLTISPYEIIVSVRSSSSRDDPFGSLFGGYGTNQRRLELQSDPVSVIAHDLPPRENQVFTGAVGNFDIRRTINSRSAVVGETIEVTTRFTGVGNIPLITKPQYTVPEGLEVYDPQENSSINRRNHEISGSKQFTDVLIARTPGSFTLPGTTLTYFNPVRNRYETERLDPITFEVRRDPRAASSAAPSPTFDIQPMTGLAQWTTPGSTPLAARWWFWLGLALPFAAAGLGYWQKRYRDKMATDRHFARSRTAYDRASERLDKTLELSEQGAIKEAYNTLYKAITGYIGDRLGLPEAGLSDAQYISALRDEGIGEEMVKNVRMLLDKCSTISYAPETSHEYMKSHVGLARKILDRFKKEL